ncbi:hypothetical protein AB6805_28755 [Chitinophaga sp. RCC_12]|uniref:hypothetical protein n=1 Tax=Chitinophaga sp. RCC_12 TaxID=3239226 RepID=UPI0035256B08
MNRAIITCILFICISQLLFAQDANYWSGNYGPGGFFTPGAVIANNKDSGVLFYNPALQALTRKKTASISGTVYQVESIKIKDGAGTGKSLHSRITSSVPQMLSGIVSLGRRKPVYIGYALTHTAVLNYNVSQQQDTKLNVVDGSGSPGLEYYLGQYNFQNLTRETSALISTGFKLSDRWAIGFMAEGQSRSQHYSETVSARALIGSNTSSTLPLASNEGAYQVDYHHIGLKLKAGLSYEVTKHHFGFLLSSPLIHIRGRGTLLSNMAIANVRFLDEDPINLLANTRQTNLKTNYKVPASAAFGYAYDYRKGQVYMAAEYFLKIKDYNILTPRPEIFQRPDTGNSNSSAIALLEMREGRKAIFNMSVGVSYQLKPQLTGYCSLRTDFNYASRENTDGFSPNTSTWDNYYCQLGVNIKRRQYNLRTGILLGYGHTGSYQQPINFDDPKESNLLTGTIGAVPATRVTAALMIAFIHNL